MTHDRPATLSPTRLPRIRDELAATIAHARTTVATNPNHSHTMLDAARHLTASELYWVSRDMTQVALDASEDLPTYTPAAVLPADYGMLIWDGNMPPLPVTALPRQAWPTGPLGIPQVPLAPVAGITWSHYGGHLHLRALMHTEAIPLAEGRALEGTLQIGATLAPLPADQPHAPEDVRGDAAGLVAATVATWIMMAQPTVATTRTVTSKHAGAGRKKTKKTGGKGRGWEVGVIELRRLQPGRTTDEDDTGQARQYTHRWVVRGHWRNQAHGPGRKLRRPTWVPSYTKGPEGAPLLAREHVHVWRR